MDKSVFDDPQSVKDLRDVCKGLLEFRKYEVKGGLCCREQYTVKRRNMSVAQTVVDSPLLGCLEKW